MNPRDKKMLKEFMKHLQKRWIVIDNGMYRDNSSFCKREVNRGGEIVLNLYAKWKSISDELADFEIDSFVRLLADEIGYNK